MFNKVCLANAEGENEDMEQIMGKHGLGIGNNNIMTRGQASSVKRMGL